jgi:hypothetical protein
VVVSGQPSIIATGTDTLELIAGTGIIITTNPNASPYKQIRLQVDSRLYYTRFEVDELFRLQTVDYGFINSGVDEFDDYGLTDESFTETLDYGLITG